MKIVTKYLPFVLLSALLTSLCQAKDYPYRWVYVSSRMNDDNDVRDIERIVRTASEHGLNGMVFAAGLDLLDLQRPDYLTRLQQVRRICDTHNIEIIPAIFSVGYAGSILAHDKNLAAGILVKDALFVVENAKARLIPDPPVKILNDDFEIFSGNSLFGYRFHDRPGEVSFADKTVFKSGKASLRFENFGKFEYGHGRLMQEVKVHPNRCYKLSCWVRMESLEPAGSFRMTVL